MNCVFCVIVKDEIISYEIFRIVFVRFFDMYVYNNIISYLDTLTRGDYSADSYLEGMKVEKKSTEVIGKTYSKP